MTNILLVCSAGMSTSLLMTKMSEAAKEKGVDVNVWAVSEAEVKDNIDKADILLLAPQVRFLKTRIEEMLAGRIPLQIIDMQAYGTLNGKKVLDDALKTL